MKDEILAVDLETAAKEEKRENNQFSGIIFLTTLLCFLFVFWLAIGEFPLLMWSWPAFMLSTITTLLLSGEKRIRFRSVLNIMIVGTATAALVIPNCLHWYTSLYERYTSVRAIAEFDIKSAEVTDLEDRTLYEFSNTEIASLQNSARSAHMHLLSHPKYTMKRYLHITLQDGRSRTFPAAITESAPEDLQFSFKEFSGSENITIRHLGYLLHKQ
jgi:hypothetical protein